MSKPFGIGLRLDSETWLAVGRMIFGREVRVARTGRWAEDFNYEWDPARPHFLFHCNACGRSFGSMTTPTRCYYIDCQHAPTLEDGVEVTHKSYTGVTLPFAI